MSQAKAAGSPEKKLLEKKSKQLRDKIYNTKKRARLKFLTPPNSTASASTAASERKRKRSTKQKLPVGSSSSLEDFQTSR